MTSSWRIPNFLDDAQGRLHIDGVDAVELARLHGTPLFVFSESRIRHNIERLRAAASSIPRPLKLCYAAKAISTLGVLRAVRDAECDIEVNSGGELQKAIAAGFTGDQIIFNGTSKEQWELELAIENSIYAIQVDSLFELGEIARIAASLGRRASVSLRLVPEITSATRSGLQTALLTSKFGMMPDEAYSAFAEYRDSPHVHLAGIHLHIGSQNPSPDVYTGALEMMFDSLAKIYEVSGVKLGHINLGGGFPVNYLRDGNQLADFPLDEQLMFSADFEPSDAIGRAWDSMSRRAEAAGLAHLLDGITLLLEPGRSIVADAGVCLTTVRNRKSRPVERSSTDAVSGDATDTWLLTDAGFNILLSMETYKWYYHLISAERAADPHDTPYKLAGPLCDGGDVYFDVEGEGRLPDHRLLPQGLEPGEILALLNCGAYSLAQASQYNGRGLPPVVLIGIDKEPRLIRRRETFEDLIASDVFPDQTPA